MFDYHTVAVISHATKVISASLEQYINCEIPYVQARFRKDRGTRDQIANIGWMIEKQRGF